MPGQRRRIRGGAALAVFVSLASSCGHGGSGGGPPASIAVAPSAAAAARPSSGQGSGLQMEASFIRANPKDVLVAWYVYGGDRVALWYARTDKAPPRAEDEFEIEVLTRRALVQEWAQLRAGGVAPDAYLDLMAEIEREDLMNGIRPVTGVGDQLLAGVYRFSSRWREHERAATSGRSGFSAGRTAV